MATIDELRDYYDNADMSESILRAEAETEVAEEILVSTSIRLPRSLMGQIRERAAEADIPATTLMRQWIIDRMEVDGGQEVIPVAEIERFIAAHKSVVKEAPVRSKLARKATRLKQGRRKETNVS